MAVTRSSSAKKVVCTAVAVKVAKPSSRKNIPWDDNYTKLIPFEEEHGHCNPHYSTQLGKWCSLQCENFKAKLSLYQYQIDKLVSISFQFEVRHPKPKKALSWAWLAMLGFVSVGYIPKRQTFVSVADMLTMLGRQVGNILLSRPIFLPTKLCRGIVFPTQFSTCM